MRPKIIQKLPSPTKKAHYVSGLRVICYRVREIGKD